MLLLEPLVGEPQYAVLSSTQPSWSPGEPAAPPPVAHYLQLGVERLRVLACTLTAFMLALSLTLAGARVWALAAFNLGVEAGQLLFVAVLLLLVRALRPMQRITVWAMQDNGGAEQVLPPRAIDIIKGRLNAGGDPKVQVYEAVMHTTHPVEPPAPDCSVAPGLHPEQLCVSAQVDCAALEERLWGSSVWYEVPAP